MKEKYAASQQLIKETNLNLIFNLINKRGAVSRAELAQITRLSPTTVSSLTEELLQDKMILETGAGTTTTSGRKPIMLEVNPRGGIVASVEMLTDGFFLCLYDLKCREIEGKNCVVADYRRIGEEIVKDLDVIFKRRKLDENKLLGICIGVPGLIDEETKRVISSTVIPIEEDNPFYSVIKSRFTGIPILMENESGISAYAEREFGGTEDIQNLVYIDINAGVGSGIILGREIFKGSFGMAGELGHVSIDMNGPRCRCGNRGCLETLAGIPAILQKIIAAVMLGENTVIKELTGNDYNRINLEVIRRALEAKDRLAMEVVAEAANKLAFGINNIINFMNPGVIVIGGKITVLGDFYLTQVRKSLEEIALKPNVNKVEIKYSRIQGSAAALGGAKYVLDHIFRTNSLYGKYLI